MFRQKVKISSLSTDEPFTAKVHDFLVISIIGQGIIVKRCGCFEDLFVGRNVGN